MKELLSIAAQEGLPHIYHKKILREMEGRKRKAHRSKIWGIEKGGSNDRPFFIL